MIVKRAGKERETEVVDREQKIKEEFDRLDQFKINIAIARITLNLNQMRTNVDTFEHIRTSSAEKDIHTFGKDGVGGITSDKVCVQVDGNKANFWIDRDLYALLPSKDNLRNPDELMKIPGFKIYVPVFKAIENCDILITGVTATANIQEIEERLKLEHKIISELSGSIKTHGLETVTDALARYTSNRVEPKTELADPIRVRFEILLFESSLNSELHDLQTVGAARVLDFPGGKKIRVNGLEGIGVLDTDGLVVQVDKKQAKVFMDDSAYFVIGRDVLKDTELPPQEACNGIIKNSESLPDEIRHFPSILKVLSDSGIEVSEFSLKSADELQKIAELLVEQTWIVSRHRRHDKPAEEVLQEIVSAVGDPQRINDAFARYGINDRVSGVLVETKKEETPQPHPVAKVMPADLTEAILGSFKAMKSKMVDEKFGSIEIVGLGEVKAINLNEDVIISCSEKSALVIIDEDLLSSAMKHAKLEDEEELLNKLELLEGNKEFREFVATIKALKETGTEKFKITTSGHDSEYYLNQAREICAPAAAFMEERAKGKSIVETVKILMGSTTMNTVVESLSKTGFSEEAGEVSAYLEQAKIATDKFNSMISEWVENKAVPSKEGLLKCAESLKMTQKEFETTLESALSEMRESNISSEKNVVSYQDRLDDPTLVDEFKKEFERFVNEGNKSIQENNARIEKIEDALRILRGA